MVALTSTLVSHQAWKPYGENERQRDGEKFFDRRYEIGTEAHRLELGLTEHGYVAKMQSFE